MMGKGEKGKRGKNPGNNIPASVEKTTFNFPANRQEAL